MTEATTYFCDKCRVQVPLSHACPIAMLLGIRSTFDQTAELALQAMSDRAEAIKILRELQLEASLYIGYGFDRTNESEKLSAACSKTRAFLERFPEET